MAKWFRSEPMDYISLIVNEDAAHDCLADLGKLGAIQFTDLNPDLTPFQRRYVSYVKRCDELERKLRYFSTEVDKFEHIKIASAGTVNDFVENNTVLDGPSEKTGGQLLEALETDLESYETNLRELNSMGQRLTTEFNEKMELQQVLLKAQTWYTKDKSRLEGYSVPTLDKDSSSTKADLLSAEGGRASEMKFSYISGVVTNEEKNRFERMIFRTTRGNCYLRFAEIEDPIRDPVTGLDVEKSVFIVFYKSQSIETKLNKICDAFSAHRYTIPSPENAQAIGEQLNENGQELHDSGKILKTNVETRERLCQTLSKHTERWTWTVLREKAVYHTLNMFKADVHGMLRGEGWVVNECYDAAKAAVELAHSKKDAAMTSLVDHVPKPWPTPPTHFQTNAFTYGYQEFVNTYGIPRYREANPALFTAATFPFLFGVMYGDVGHGSILLLAGLYLLWNGKANENKKLGELMDGMHMGRYMITMMGFFAVYAGLIYNDCFSLGLNLFGSRWAFSGQETGTVADGDVAEPIAKYGTDESVYIFGLDPVWHVTGNELLFFNSFKMKLSVVFGIIQMFCGTCLKGCNAIYFKQKLDFFYEFVPMVVFAASLFLYMVFLIFYKWSTDWNSRMLSATCMIPEEQYGWGSDAYNGDWVKCDLSGDGTCTPWGYSCTGTDDTATKCALDLGGSGDGCQPPNLITTLINIALQPGDCDEPMFAGQAFLQTVLLLLAFGSVPVLLLAKPIILSRKHSASTAIVHANDPESGAEEEHGSEEDHGFGEIVIHQAIETIEFVLGMISNTASYLRLWALSLAHSELATVFWEKAMLTTLNKGWFAAYFGYAIFAGVTTGVLLMMDVLECFLHALRLHWVEFQNKFFFADGVRFAPYSFKQIIKDSQY